MLAWRTDLWFVPVLQRSSIAESKFQSMNPFERKAIIFHLDSTSMAIILMS